MNSQTRARYCNLIALLANPTGLRVVVELLMNRIYIVLTKNYTREEAMRRRCLRYIPFIYTNATSRRIYDIENLKCTISTLYELNDIMQPCNEKYRNQIQRFLINYSLHTNICGVPLTVILACECRKNGHKNHDDDSEMNQRRGLYVSVRPKSRGRKVQSTHVWVTDGP